MPTDQNEALDRATEAARKVLQRAKWCVRKDDEVAVRQLRRAVEAAVAELPEKVVYRKRPGDLTLDEARSLASTYRGGEGHHPLALHRDSMG